MNPFTFNLGDRVKLVEKTIPYDTAKDQGVIDALTIDGKGTYASVIWNIKGWRTLERESNLRRL